MDDADAQALLSALLKDLGDAGLGAERSSGYGQAQITADQPLTLPDPNGGAWTTLSRYLPAEDEIVALQTPAAAYQVTRLSGWMDGRGLRRRAVNLLSEGAVLGPLDKSAPWGSAVDVKPQPGEMGNFTTPDHPVWRLGWTVAVGYGGDQ
jgi:CRISPR type III-A-associated RAMP protein Csm4